MALTLERPMSEHPSAATGLHAVYCVRCGNPRPLALVGLGTLVLRFKDHEYRIDNLTPGQRVWAKCLPCGKQQRIAVPN